MPIKWNTYKVIFETNQNAETAVDKMCSYLTGDIKRSMKPGAHRPWPSGKGDGTTHYSSSPGSAPAPDTKELLDSISYSTTNGKQSGVGSNSTVPNVGSPTPSPDGPKGAVGTRDEKGLYMEMGVKESNVAPRPFLRTALSRTKEILNRIFINTMKRMK